MGKKVFMEKKKLFTGRPKMNLEEEEDYEMLGLECSTVCSRDVDVDVDGQKKIEDFEMWIWRSMEQVSWLDKVTSEKVFRRVNEDRQILNYIWQRRRRWIGHVLRHDRLLHEIVEGRMKGDKNEENNSNAT